VPATPKGGLARPSSGLRRELARRLRERRAEIEQAVEARLQAIADGEDAGDPVYLEGLRAAVAAAIDYALLSVEQGERASPPPVLLAQARLAARSGVSLDTVLRRYLAGYTLFVDFVVEVAEKSDLRGGRGLRDVLRSQAVLFDRLLSLVAEEHRREPQAQLESSEERRAKRVEQLLAGELVDPVELEYELDAQHLAAVVASSNSAVPLRRLAEALDRRMLTVHREDATTWVWLGGRREVGRAELNRLVESLWPGDVPIALGEPGKGIAGWRLSHRQAKAGWFFAKHSERTVTRYATVALLASMLRDELLCTSLRQIYLAPLKAERDGGAVAMSTLRAYFAVGRNVSSAAAILGVTRQTVGNRLRGIEETLEESLRQCSSEIEAALLLDAALEDRARLES
jgi:hypothetical protein